MAVAGDEQLQYGGRSVGERGLGDEGLRPALQGPADNERPLLLETRDDRGELIEPFGGAGRERLGAHDLRNVGHAAPRPGGLVAVFAAAANLVHVEQRAGEQEHHDREREECRAAVLARVDELLSE